MQLKCTLERVDFIPIVKFGGKIWQPAKTLAKGSIFDVQDEIGHQLLSGYPGAFEVLAFGEAAKRTRTKQVTKESLQHVDGGAAE